MCKEIQKKIIIQNQNSWSEYSMGETKKARDLGDTADLTSGIPRASRLPCLAHGQERGACKLGFSDFLDSQVQLVAWTIQLHSGSSLFPNSKANYLPG